MRSCVFLLALVTSWTGVTQCTPLDDYVNKFDPHYSYTLISKTEGPDFSLHVLNMTSQKWLDETVTKKPIWWHYLSVIIPKNLDYTDTGFLWIDQGHNTDKPPTIADDFVAGITILAVNIRAVCATIKQIPNQPTVFWADPTLMNRTEDAVIAWTWREFLSNGSNPEILLRLPMTKAVVRGFDTVSAYMKIIAGIDIQKFVVAGASKRGWTTWTTAAVDKRVIGMVPCVMDLLNFQKNLHHHYRSLGGWTFAFDSYYSLNITKDLDSPNIPKMQAVIDPISYNERYTMPKMVVTTGGDEFFIPDDSHYYWDQLQGPKFLRITPNAEHSIVGHLMSTILAIQGFFFHVVEKATFPTLTWTRSQNNTSGTIVVTTSVPPREVTVYYAQTLDNKRRDFRLFTADPQTGKALFHPVIWFSKQATRLSLNQYQATVERPSYGWAAFFIQLKFDGLKGSTLEFTTEANIVPDEFPFPDCSGQSCRGTLV
ncbi:autocrine proliferation repressor protein A-like [Physella acuta]|uniref:autocrine proliferation repressor protein A-like n=1 Tax=Physella acuta TaxID=109671 RepID=UPI0027DD7D89|nr:autocrine proliferation repressor protein A-like [Physella acuta]XP_059147479.1 autocrine proliferation repressor protein A-like [Physella acuta]